MVTSPRWRGGSGRRSQPESKSRAATSAVPLTRLDQLASDFVLPSAGAHGFSLLQERALDVHPEGIDRAPERAFGSGFDTAVALGLDTGSRDLERRGSGVVLLHPAPDLVVSQGDERGMNPRREVVRPLVALDAIDEGLGRGRQVRGGWGGGR